jgi:formate hydrogenlyase subunit 6/NADH:ubiquinone oxidoreductase subunit I
MVKDYSETSWHGVPRKEIPWFPTVDVDKCIGCELCYVTCGREVYEMVDKENRRKSSAARPYNCMVGCSTCGMVCPTQAISFPSRDLMWGIEREYKIFGKVRKEAEAKREKQREDALKERNIAEEEIAGLRTKSRVVIAGEFGEKRFVARLEELVRDHPFDIVDLKLEIPTVKGLLEKTPAYMSFEVTSTEQQNIDDFISLLKTLVRENDLVWVSDT